MTALSTAEREAIIAKIAELMESCGLEGWAEIWRDEPRNRFRAATALADHIARALGPDDAAKVRDWCAMVVPECRFAAVLDALDAGDADIAAGFADKVRRGAR